MILPHILPSNLNRRAFTRRTDLTSEIRLFLALTALQAMLYGGWGTISDLAAQFEVSRTFIYMLAHQLQDVGHFIFEQSNITAQSVSLRELSIQTMLSLRLEGRSSIMGISSIMNRLGLELASTGSISQTLCRIGAALPSTIPVDGFVVQYVVYASDEIYAHSVPILVTVDPISTVIIRIELCDSRTAEDWKRHYEHISANGFQPTILVSDGAKGIQAGFEKTTPDATQQYDTYHAIAHQLGNWINRLEKIAYRAIKEEHNAQKKSEKKKNAENIDRYHKAVQAAKKAIENYENFCYLYRLLIKELAVFDDQGALCEAQVAETNIQAVIELLKEIGISKLTKAANKVERTLPKLFHYFDIAKQAIASCKELPINEESLQFYCIAWQARKNARKAKESDRRQAMLEQEQIALEMAQTSAELDWDEMRQKIYAKLDTIVQSSSMVECVNSIIRPYLNVSKNQVNQNALNLIMHYHNYRRYTDGVRKGKTPMEILTGKKQEKDWLAMLLDIIREKDPEILLAS